MNTVQGQSREGFLVVLLCANHQFNDILMLYEYELLVLRTVSESISSFVVFIMLVRVRVDLVES